MAQDPRGLFRSACHSGCRPLLRTCKNSMSGYMALSSPLPPACRMLTSPHSLQRCLLLVMELKVSPQLLHPGFSLSRLVLEDNFLDSIYKEASGCHQLWSVSARWPAVGGWGQGRSGAKDSAGDNAQSKSGHCRRE